VLDEWFEQEVTPRLTGEAYIVRFADDFICLFEQESDLKRFHAVLRKRLGRYSLELAQEKTKSLRFGRFARRDRQRLGNGAPGTFDFLGFTHYCGRNRSGSFKLKRRTATKKLRAKIADLKDWLRSQLTIPKAEVWPTLCRKLRGHYQYYHVNDNWKLVMKFREEARRLAFRWLRRRSHKGSQLSWADYDRYLQHFPLPLPGQIVDLIALGRSL